MSIIKSILGLFSNDLLIELGEELITVKVFGENTELDLAPYVAIHDINEKSIIRDIGAGARVFTEKKIRIVNPFSHSRSMVGDFQVAEKVIQYAVQKVHKNRFFSPAPRVVMYQLEKAEGGLSDVEIKVLRELALSAGAREVIVHEGKRINTLHRTYAEVSAANDIV